MMQQEGPDHDVAVENEPLVARSGGAASRTVTRGGSLRSLARDLIAQWQRLDVVNQATLFGAGLLISLLPCLILLSSFASGRVDDDIALRLGLDNRASGIVSHLFNSSSASLNAATITSAIFVVAGMLAVASSLQQIYEKAFHQEHRGFRDVPRLLTWIAVLCGVVAFESVVGRPVRNAAAGTGLVEVVTFAIFMPFFWWTTHFLLRGQVGWRRLLPSAVATGIGFVALGVFSRFYFSSSIISDDKTYGAIGAVFSLMTWLIGIGAVIMFGAAAGAVWNERRAG
jgi:membrane protein